MRRGERTKNIVIHQEEQMRDISARHSPCTLSVPSSHQIASCGCWGGRALRKKSWMKKKSWKKMRRWKKMKSWKRMKSGEMRREEELEEELRRWRGGERAWGRMRETSKIEVFFFHLICCNCGLTYCHFLYCHTWSADLSSPSFLIFYSSLRFNCFLKHAGTQTGKPPSFCLKSCWTFSRNFRMAKSLHWLFPSLRFTCFSDFSQASQILCFTICVAFWIQLRSFAPSFMLPFHRHFTNFLTHIQKSRKTAVASETSSKLAKLALEKATLIDDGTWVEVGKDEEGGEERWWCMMMRMRPDFDEFHFIILNFLFACSGVITRLWKLLLSAFSLFSLAFFLEYRQWE